VGLATAYSIVAQHGGIVTVESTFGAGACFTVLLPALLVAPIVDTPISLPEKPVVSGRSEGRILVLDDEEMIRVLVNHMLTRLGYEVVITADGAETLTCFENALREGRPFDAVLLDLTIPGGQGGKEVVQHIKALDPSVNAIVSSGYYNDPVLARYQEYGFTGMVPKPYKVQELLQTLQRTPSDSSARGS